jgi:ribonuclease R
VKPGTALDEEARARGNSTYFPAHVIPMLPEILSNGVCSLQEGVPRLCKSAFIRYDQDAHPIGTRFANTVIRSARRLRYTEAQALIDGKKEIPHPDGVKSIDDYDLQLLKHLHNMDELARRLQKRRRDAGQLVLDLPAIDLVLDDEGKVIDAVPEDESFTHTLIEMFMVEANEAVARLLDGHDFPFLRRIHPDPDAQDAERIRHFSQVVGYQLNKIVDRKALQQLLAAAAGKPESFAVNMAVLKSLARAEYSPQAVGHYALASTHYCHFTSPIRRYADLTIHRLLDTYFEARENAGPAKGGQRRKLEFGDVPSEKDLIDLGRHLSFTERRSEDAERELRQVKILMLLKNHIGEEMPGVVSGIANFGIFIQLDTWLIDGLIRYEDLMDDWWDVDTRGGFVRGQRTGKKIAIGDVVHVVIVNVDLARRELNLAVVKHVGKTGVASAMQAPDRNRPPKTKSKKPKHSQKKQQRRGSGGGRGRRR